MTDLGYYGLEQDGFKLLMPKKKKKNLPLFDVEKKYNKMIGKIRVVIEHINSQLKTFRILSERYRNRRKRFGLRIEPYRVCRRVNILRDYPDDKIKIYP